MNDSQGAKQQIVERIKSSSNILVTVSTDPSVDELSAALGLTIMLNNIDKHATAVVSGAIPPAITFLDPEKTFENTVDSLRDFIIALDKEKADHLRYKVDGDVVKIFITPYRTTITSDDLEFSQGDYNVELVLALGVKTKEHLDAALTAHGRILHDATVATVSCGGESSNLGSIDWTEANASSLSEMLVALSEALKGDKPLLDEQVATAFLTGIVAATDRFSNNRTSSKVMTMAAQLMAAGANQQLIAAKLEEAHEIGEDKDAQDGGQGNPDGTTPLDEDKPTKLKREGATAPDNATKDDGSLDISHKKEEMIEEAAAATAEKNQTDAAKQAEENLAKQLETVAPAAAKPSVADLQKDLAAASNEVEKAAEQPIGSPEAALPPVSPVSGQEAGPVMGGTLNATAEQAQKDTEKELEDDRNKTILTHEDGDYAKSSDSSFQAPFNAASKPSDEPPSVDIFKDQGLIATPEQSPSTPPTSGETLADIERQHRHSDDHSEAQAAVAAAYEAAPFDPAHNPQVDIGAQPLGDVPHSSPLTAALPPQPSVVPPALPPVPDDFSALPLPPPPPVPSFDQPQGPLPPEQLGQIFGSPSPDQPTAIPPQPKDPNQFQIPNQR